MEFTERMEAGRDAAAHHRHRGLHTGASAQGWDYARRESEAGTWDHHHDKTLHGFRWAVDEAAEDYRRAVFPERYDTSDLEF